MARKKRKGFIRGFTIRNFLEAILAKLRFLYLIGYGLCLFLTWQRFNGGITREAIFSHHTYITTSDSLKGRADNRYILYYRFIKLPARFECPMVKWFALGPQQSHPLPYRSPSQFPSRVGRV